MRMRFSSLDRQRRCRVTAIWTLSVEPRRWSALADVDRSTRASKRGSGGGAERAALPWQKPAMLEAIWKHSGLHARSVSMGVVTDKLMCHGPGPGHTEACE